MAQKARVPAVPGTKEQILESAIVLMRQSGLSGAGINQILAHSKAPKGSMYYHFPQGKMQISREALARYGARVADMFETTLSSKKNPRDKIRALFRAVANRLQQYDFDQSCAAGAVALNLNDDVSELRPVVAKVMRTWCDIIGSHFPMRNRAERASFAGLVLSAIEGGYIRGRAERSSAPVTEAGEWIARLVQSEFARSSGP